MWVKICGIRDVRMATEVARFAPSAIGLNFFLQSPRAVTPNVAAEIVRVLPPEIQPVGVFVNHTVSDIVASCRSCHLDMVQLHGDEPPRFLADLKSVLPSVPIIRAYRLGRAGLEPLAEYLEECCNWDAVPAACLIDAHVEGAYGGTGRTVSWDLLQQGYLRDQWPRLILAGGLRPENVRNAIQTVRPWGVDVSSGVESAPGQKDLAHVERFLSEARQAFESFDEK